MQSRIRHAKVKLRRCRAPPAAVTDGGIDISAEKRSRVDAMFERLSEIGNGQEPRPLDSPLIYGNYEVSYVSSGKSQQGQRESPVRSASSAEGAP